MVVSPGILVLALTQESENDHCLLLIRGRPYDVWVITDPSINPGKFQFKYSQDTGPDYLIIHPKHCTVAAGGEAREAETV